MSNTHPRVEYRELSKQQSLPDFSHSVKVKVDVMMGGEDGAQHLAGDEEVAKVAARIAAANRTGAGGVGRALIPRVTGVLDDDFALGGEQAGVARVAGRHY